MSSNVRFTIHSDSENDTGELELYTILIQSPVQSDSLFTMLNMATIIHPILESIDPLELVMENTSNEQDLQRQEDVHITVPSELYSKTDKRWTECSICTETFKDNDFVSTLNCNHLFHTKCIKEWGHYNPSCPICKTDIPIQ